MVNFSSFYTSFGGPKITVLSFCLDFAVYPWIKALHVSFLFLFLFCFLGNSSLKVFQPFPFHRRCFSQTIQASAEVNENRFLLRARRETLWRFSCLDGDFTHWALFFLKVVNLLDIFPFSLFFFWPRFLEPFSHGLVGFHHQIPRSYGIIRPFQAFLPRELGPLWPFPR